MGQIKILVLSKKKIKRAFFTAAASIIGIYFLISFYFFTHFCFNTEINGVWVSLKAHTQAPAMISQFIERYQLQLLERNKETEVIRRQDIDMKYNKNITLSQFKRLQNPFLWMGSLFKDNIYSIDNLYSYNKESLNNKINSLKCLNTPVTKSQNPGFRYSGTSYEIIKERYGNEINVDCFVRLIDQYIATGKTQLDLNSMNCYINPKYTANSKKTFKTKNLLDKYASAKITYRFGTATEEVNGSLINRWLSVDGNLDVIINKPEIVEYIKALSKKYNTVGITREFQTSTGRKIEIGGGLYGWKMDCDTEAEALFGHIKRQDVLEKEPAYLQRAFSREGNEIGNTYLEINITRQHVWFYKNGKLIIQGAVVTGNPNRGNSTVLGVYMINYKQKGAILTGPGYESKVTYWMPFFGNIGLHDASWRYQFGGTIYKTRGTHGCVNAPLYLAKTVFENIEAGTPVIVYEEDK